jgi:predicted ATP-grasp superfamily ATP-dependent carboligase
VASCDEWSREAVLEKLIEIGRNAERKSSLLITKEEPVRWISDARDKLDEYYEISLPDRSMVDLLLDKAAFDRQCVQEGWPTPRTWIIESRSQLQSALPAIPFPCILKPQVKSAFFGDRAPAKAFKLNDAGELLRTYEMVAQWAERFILQEWIHGGEDRIAFCLTYFDRSGGRQAMFVGRKLRQWPPECGNTALCEPAPESWREPIIGLTEKIWRRVRFKGLGSIEYKMRLADEPVIIEPTVGRTNYQNEIAVLNGVNIPLIAHCDMVGLPRPEAQILSRPCKLVDGMREVRGARYYLRNGRLTYRRWRHDRRGRCRYMTFRANDPGPLWASMRESLRSLAGTLLERVFGRVYKEKLKRVISSTLRTHGTRPRLGP